MDEFNGTVGTVVSTHGLDGVIGVSFGTGRVYYYRSSWLRKEDKFHNTVGFSIPKHDYAYGRVFTFRESWLIPASEFKPNNNELDKLFKECDL